MSLPVNVTQHHIEQGIPGLSCRCPIALAIRDTIYALTGKVVPVLVRTINVEINDSDYDLPFVATNFIRRYDTLRSVKPFTFTIRGYQP